MSKSPVNQALIGDTRSPIANFKALSINSCTSTEVCSSIINGSDCEESEKSSLSSSSYCTTVNNNSNETSFRSFCASKPHKGNDPGWDSIQSVKVKDGDLGLGHFRLLKKLGFGDIGSVYLAELRGTGCLFAMKVMDKGRRKEEIS